MDLTSAELTRRVEDLEKDMDKAFEKLDKHADDLHEKLNKLTVGVAILQHQDRRALIWLGLILTAGQIMAALIPHAH